MFDIHPFYKLFALLLFCSSVAFSQESQLKEATVKKANSDSLTEKTKRAIDGYKLVIESYPENADAYCSLAEQYWVIDQQEDAINALEHAIKIKPGPIDPYYRLAYFYREAERYEESFGIYNRIAAARPNELRLLFAAGELFCIRGNFAKGIQYFQKADKLQPQNTTALFNIALTHLRMGFPEKAIEKYRSAMKLSKSQNLGTPYGAIEDLQSLIHTGILVSEAAQILQQVFNISQKKNGTVNKDKRQKTYPIALTKQPTVIKNVNPEYPELAKEAGIKGAVVTRVLVDRNGNVEAVEIKTAHQYELLNSAAIDAAWQFKFSTGMQGDTPVKAWMNLPFRFRLR